MQLRRLPVLAATLAPLSGCALLEPIIGEWDLIDLEFGVSDDAVDLEVEGEMEVDEELLGEFEFVLHVHGETTAGDEATARYESAFEISVENEGDDAYTIELEDLFSDYESEMSCTRDTTELECEEEDGIHFFFEKKK